MWRTDTGLPQNSVRAILQTHDGYLWFATREGLARFDGLAFTLYNRRNSPQLLSNDIRSLAEDRQGNLWIGTAGGVARWDGSSFEAFTRSQGLPNGGVTNIFQDNQGCIWIVTTGGLAQLRQGRFISYTARQGLSSDDIEALASGPEGSLWVATDAGLNQIRDGHVVQSRMTSAASGGPIQAMVSDRFGDLWIDTQQGLRRLSSAQRRTYGKAQGLAENPANVLLSDRSGSIWVGTSSGLSVLQNNAVRTYTTADGLPGNQIETLYQDGEGTLWVGTNHGLARVRRGKVDAFSSKLDRTGAPILAIYEDREGSLWIGTESDGVAVLRDKKFSTLTVSDGLSAELVSSVVQDRRGHIWIGTDGGGLDAYDNGTVSVFTQKQGLTSDTVLSLAPGAAGDLWIGTPNGLDHMENGKLDAAVSADLLPDQFVRSLLTGPDASLWVGTRHGLAHLEHLRSGGARSSIYTRADGLPDDFIGALAEGKDGSLWVGTPHGLSHLRHGRFGNYTEENGLSNNVITALYVDADGNLWIGTNGEGLNLLRSSGVLYSFPESLELPDVIDGILEDGSGHLWISSNTGIFRVHRSELLDVASGRALKAAVSSFDTSDGMKIRECSGIGHPSSWKAADGTMWFATLKGVAWIRPGRSRRNLVPPLVSIEQASADGVNLPLAKPIAVGPGHPGLAFRYAGSSFVAPEKMRFKYRLVGFDRSWVDAGTRRVAYYTNIPPGSYSFKVVAANNDGVWSTAPAVFAFRVRPYFYQTYWFDLLCAMVAAFLAWLAYHWRVRQVESKFSAVLAERTRIAREIHDTLAQNFVGISLQLELAAQMLTTSPHSIAGQLDHIRKLVRDSLSEARRSIWNLRSADTGTDGLPARLSSAIRRQTTGSSLQAEIRVSGAYRPLSESIEQALLKIALEAVTNVQRHANATRVEIELQFAISQLLLKIEDDGQGFVPGSSASRHHGHFGLVGMRERAEALGGSFALDSSPGAGTRIRVQIPIEKCSMEADLPLAENNVSENRRANA